MNFQTLEYVRAVAEERSFTHAADRLHVTQQTLSAHIAGVERELGCQLFVRRTPLEVTHEGRAFLSHADAVARELADLRRDVSGDARDQAGTLRIAVAYTRGRAVLPAVIERFVAQYPNIRVQLDEDTNEALFSALADGREDLAIGVMPEDIGGLEVVPYYEEHIVLMAERGLLGRCGIDEDAVREPLSRGDFTPLAGCPFVLGGPSDITGGLGLSLFARAGIDPVVRVQSNNMETLLALATRGVGACFCPENLVPVATSAEQRSALVKFDLGPSSRYQIRFARPARGYRWPVADAFVDLARSLAAGDGSSGDAGQESVDQRS